MRVDETPRDRSHHGAGPEGEDKPLKYPVMFKAADLVLLTKCDLVPHLDVELAKVHDALARVMPRPKVIEVSARSGQDTKARSPIHAQ